MWTRRRENHIRWKYFSEANVRVWDLRENLEIVPGIAERVRFLEFLGDAAGSRRACRRSKSASFEARRARVTYEFKGFRETPPVRRRRRARASACTRSRWTAYTGRLLSSSTAWGRMKTSRASWQLKVCHFSLLLRTFTLPPASLARCLSRTPCTRLFVRPFRATSSALFVFPPRHTAGGPILARGRSAKCSVAKTDKDQANREDDGEKGRDYQRASERDVETQRAEIIGCACALINLYTLPGCEYHQSSSFLPAMHRYTLVDDTCVCFTMIGHTRADRLIESTVGVRESFSFMRILSGIGLKQNGRGCALLFVLRKGN